MMRRFFYGLCIVVFILAVSQMVLKQASAKSVPETQAQIQLSFAPLVKKVKPAVVNIYTPYPENRSPHQRTAQKTDRP